MKTYARKHNAKKKILGVDPQKISELMTIIEQGKQERQLKGHAMLINRVAPKTTEKDMKLNNIIMKIRAY